MANGDYSLKQASLDNVGSVPLAAAEGSHTQAAIATQPQDSVAHLGLALTNASVAISGLNVSQGLLRDSVDVLNASLLSHAQLLGASAARQKENEAWQSSPSTDTSKPQATNGAVAQPPVLSKALDGAMTDLDQLLQFQGRQRKHLKQANLDLVTEPVMAATGASPAELAKVEYVAAKSGIGGGSQADPQQRQQALLEFARDTAITASLFKIEVKNAGEMMGAWRTSMNLDRSQAMDLADATLRLGSSQGLQAESADIGAIVQRQGAAATGAGMQPEQVAALAAALLNAGNDKADASIGVEKISAALGNRNNASVEQQQAWATLGVDPGKQDSAGTLVAVLGALKARPPEQQATLAAQLFGGNQAILTLIPALAGVEQALALVADKQQYATSVLGERGAIMRAAAVRGDTTQARRDAYEASKKRLGAASDSASAGVAAPVVNLALWADTTALNSLSSVVEAMPNTAGAVITAANAVGAIGATVKPVVSGVFGAMADKLYGKAADKILGVGAAALSPSLGAMFAEGGACCEGGGSSKSRKGGKSGKPGKQPRTRQPRRPASADLRGTGSLGPQGAQAKASPWRSTVKKGAGLLGKTAKLGGVALAPLSMAYSAVQTVQAYREGDKVAVGSGIGSMVGTAAGAALGSLILPGVGTAIGGALGGLLGSDIGAWIGDKVATSDRLPTPADVSQKIASSAPADNRQISINPVINISGVDPTAAQQVANMVMQTLQNQLMPTMDNALAVRRGASLNDGAV